MARWSLGGSPQTEVTGLWIGRILLSLIFIISGLQKLFDFQEVSAMMSGAGIPAAGFLLVIALLIEILGGLGVLFGIYPRISALVLAVYLIPVTLIFHAFWTVSDSTYMAQFFNFWKNVAIIGGLITAAFASPGRPARKTGTEPVQ